jgi:hypothetical protein
VAAQVFASEFLSDPVSESWLLDYQYCNPTTWSNHGWYYQKLGFDACLGQPNGARDVFVRSLEPFNGVQNFFVEYRVETDGDQSGIPYGSPIVLVFANSYRVAYHMTIARDLMKFALYDPPIRFVEIGPDMPHIYRVELYADLYLFYIDGSLIDESLPEGPFPAHDSRMTWQGRAYFHPCENAWDYIRYGVIPEDSSGDYDSDAVITLPDFYFFQECLTNERPGINGGPENDTGPGCRFADFDADADVDLLDFADFQNQFAPAQP